MGLDYGFHVELHADGCWQVPESLVLPYQRPGGFCWSSGKHNVTSLFFGQDAWFPFRPELPPDWSTSQLYQSLAEFYDFEVNEWRISWLPYEELCIDQWPTERLLVAGTVRASVALLFGDGTGPFPAEELEAHGITEELTLGAIGNGWQVSSPIGYVHGKRRDGLAKLDPSVFVPVSWETTLATFLGEWFVSAFQSLRQFGDDCDLRVISTLS